MAGRPTAEVRRLLNVKSVDLARVDTLRKISVVTLSAAVLLAVTVLIGWVGGFEALTRVPAVARSRPMAPASAAIIIATALAVVLLFLVHRRLLRRLGLALVLVAAAGTGSSLAFARSTSEGAQPAGGTLFAFTVLILSTLLLATRRPPLHAFAHLLAFFQMATASVVLVGYWYGDRSLEVFPSGGELPVPAALAVLFLGASILTAQPATGLIASFVGTGGAGVVLRRLAPLALLVPPLVIWTVESQASAESFAWLAVLLSAGMFAAMFAAARTVERLDLARSVFEEDATRARRGLRQQSPMVPLVEDALRMESEALPGIDVAIRYQPASGMVAGDAYATVAMDDLKAGIVMVDVAGQGPEAALDSVRIRDGLVQGLMAGLDPSAALRGTSWLFATTGQVATAAVAVFHDSSGLLEYASAGHPPALLRSAGAVEHLLPTGPIMSATVKGDWFLTQRTMANGDLLVLYTDGLADVQAIPGGKSGVDVLSDSLGAFPGGQAQDLADWCVGATWRSGQRMRDDAALLAVRRVKHLAEADTAVS